jgi:acyl carrier protein
MEPQDNLIGEIQELFEKDLLVEVDSPDMDLLATGALDSMRLVDLLLLVEQRYGLNVPLETLDLENFRSVRKIAELISIRAAVPDGQTV